MEGRLSHEPILGYFFVLLLRKVSGLFLRLYEMRMLNDARPFLESYLLSLSSKLTAALSRDLLGDFVP
ncbi:hypothetical protein BUALT_Bualt08G0056300 [Buddleja alternifolia]|uniref:Uncharacterized protein n=1 Tax=Buddleja alternifolia TaxID=168488 RepID=A0AAV6XEY8_9LAMI|nr:hypothetical protein BUALT_Bualt08G0056300 [Buddleja alternifolia]